MISCSQSVLYWVDNEQVIFAYVYEIYSTNASHRKLSTAVSDKSSN